MTAHGVSLQTRLLPMDVHRRLQEGRGEGVVSRAGIRHEGLNAFLRQNLDGTDPAKGALLSEQLFQAAPGYVSSGKRPDELTSLLHPRTIDAITKTPDAELRLDRKSTRLNSSH